MPSHVAALEEAFPGGAFHRNLGEPVAVFRQALIDAAAKRQAAKLARAPAGASASPHSGPGIQGSDSPPGLRNG